MNPKDILTPFPASTSPGVSEFDRQLAEAETYFGADFPGHEGLTCLVCGAVVNRGWVHVRWHKGDAS